jgi:hypothetical protein
MGQKRKVVIRSKIENKIVIDKKSGVAIALSMLGKLYEAGELIWKEDLEKKAKKDRSKLNSEHRSILKTMFLDYYFRMQKPSINGAIEKMLTRNEKDEYPFMELSHKIKSITDRSVKGEKSFLENQIRFIFGTKPQLDMWIKENLK